MANMSAQILRNLVSSVFNVKATSVVLSGEISPTYMTNNSHSSGCLYSDNNWESLYGFNPQKGFVKLEHNTTNQTSNANGSWNTHNEVQLNLVDGVEDFIFFVSRKGWDYSDNNREDKGEETTLYKAPNFKDYFASVEEADLTRWEEWLNA